jgi:hypothetical protein
MADPNDPKVAKELAEAMKAVGEYAEDATGAFEQQLKIVSQMRDAMEEVAKVMYALCQQDCKALNPDVWKSVTKEILKKEKAVKSTTKSIKELARTLEKDFAKAAYVAAGAIGGLAQGFKNVFALGKSFLGLAGSVAGAVWEIGKSILSIPLKIMEGLFSMASKGGSNELDTALQGIVKKFGDLEGPAARAITHTARSFAKVNEGGIDMYRVFGNLAERVKAVQEMAEGMGATYSVFTDEVHENGVALAIYQKGLGISKEEMEGLARTALRTDRSMSDVAKNMTKYSQELSKSFAVPAKVISADMAKAMKDLAHFGHLADNELAVTAAFANKLGVSVDKLTTIMDATKTYDQTSESVSKLNETLNTNIDATKLMMLAEKGGGAQLEYLRSELKAAGKDLGNLDYFQRNLIKSTNLLSDDLINSALANKNNAVSMKKMSEAADKVTNKAYEQKDALKDLKKEVEKRPMEGMLGEGGIFDRLMQGFSMGIERSPIFMKLMMNLRQIFRDVYWAGYRMGQMFVDFFPGVKDIIEGLAGIFDPSRFKKFFSEIEKIFKDFSAEGGKDVNGLLKNLQENFLNFFDKSSPAGQKVISGFEKFWSVIAGVLNKVLEIVIGKMADIVNAITDFLVNPRIPSGATGVLNAVASPFQDAFNALADKLWPAIQRFFGVLWDKVSDFLMNDPMGQKIVSGAIALVLAPAILGGLANAAAAGLFKSFSTKFFEGLATSIASNQAGQKAVGAAAGEALETARAPELPKTSPVPPGGDLQGPANQMVGQGAAIGEKIKPMEAFQMNFAKIGANLIGLFGAVAIGLGAFKIALEMVKGVPPQQVISAGIVFGAVSLMMLPAAAMVTAMSLVTPAAVGKALLVAGALGVFMLAGLGAALAGIAIVAAAKPKTENVILTGLVAASMVPLFISVAALVAGAAAAGKMASQAPLMITGAQIVGAALVALGVVLGGVLLVASKSSPETLKKAQLVADVMSTLGTMLVKISAALLLMAPIGALVATGVGGAVLGAGFAAVMISVGQVVDTSLSIIDKVEKIKGSGPEFESKVNVFLKVASLVTDLAGKVKDLITSLDFGFFESQASKKEKMKSVEGVVTSLSTAVTSIVDAVGNNLKTISGTDIRLAGSFASILSAAGNMLGGVARATGPFFDAVKEIKYGSGKSEFKENIESLKKVFGEVTKKTGELIGKIIESLNGIQSPEKISAAGKGLSDIFTAIGSLISAISPRLGEMMTAAEGSDKDVKKIDPAAFGLWLGGITTLLDTIKDKMTGSDGLITKILPALSSLSSLSKDQIAGISSVAEVIKAISGLVSATGTVAKTEKISSYDTSGDVSKLKEVIDRTAPNLSELFDTIIKTAPDLILKLGKLAGQAAGINSDNVKKLSDMFNVIGTIMTTVGRATDSSNWRESAAWAKERGVDKWGPIEEMGAQMGFIWNVLQLLHGDKPYAGAPDISVQKIVDKLRAIGSVDQTALDASKSVGTMFTNIASIVKGISDAGGGSSIDLGKADDKVVEYGRSLYVAYHALNKLVTGVDKDGNTLGSEGGEGSLKKLSEAINKINGGLGSFNAETINAQSKNISGALSAVSSLLVKVTDIPFVEASHVNNKLGGLKDSINALMTKMSEISATIPQDLSPRIKSLIDTGSAANLKALSDVVAHANKVSQQISNLPTIAVPAQLQAFASGLGFNGSYQYKIQSQGVQINLEIHVTMDADKVEKAIVNRQTSVIRDRINYIMEQSPIKTQAITDSAYIVDGPVSSANKAKLPHTSPV